MALSPLTSSVLPVVHGFFTRKGGVSEGIYHSLNCGVGSQDNTQHVLENRRCAQEHLAADALCGLHQIHSTEVITVTAEWQHYNAPKADAMVTNLPGIALGILTADCVPVLLADAKAGIIGAAHAGWKGALGGILQNTVAAMKALGATEIAAAIGPCIAQESYQVDTLFHAHFITTAPEAERFFQRDTESASHYRFDLKGFAAAQLMAAGITRLDILPDNTYTEESHFFSYRRATHRAEPDYGRQISAIRL